MALTQERLKELLHYDPETGVFTRCKGVKGKPAGQVAGYSDPRGYVTVCVDQVSYYAHRLAWFFINGEWPDAEVDHKDRDKSNNRWSNLRAVSGAQNKENYVSSSNKTGFPGVKRERRSSKHPFVCKVVSKGKTLYIGKFKTAEEAGAAYLAKKRELHKFFI